MFCSTDIFNHVFESFGVSDSDQLWETTLDPEKRTLLEVSLGVFANDDQIFSTLMGDVVEPRRNFIQTHALEVKNLDV